MAMKATLPSASEPKSMMRAREALQPPRLFQRLAVHHLERELRPEVEPRRPPDRSHPPAPDLRVEPVLRTEDGARIEHRRIP
jgi:hypothetical protein